jgi:glycerol-3-phosphate dehydrogenase
MSAELGWNRKRQNQEFEDAKMFLLSMGMPRSKLDLTLADVRKGKVAALTNQEDALTSRAIFSSEELDSLRQTFDTIDRDRDNKIGVEDLAAAFARVGYNDVPKVRVSMAHVFLSVDV